MSAVQVLAYVLLGVYGFGVGAVTGRYWEALDGTRGRLRRSVGYGLVWFAALMVAPPASLRVQPLTPTLTLLERSGQWVPCTPVTIALYGGCPSAVSRFVAGSWPHAHEHLLLCGCRWKPDGKKVDVICADHVRTEEWS